VALTDLEPLDPGPRELYRWQLDALTSWLRCGRRGVVEAVTGSGKTDVAIAAAADALRRGRFVLVIVPTRVLMEQWHGRLTAALPGARIGRLGDTGRDGPASCDVLVATRHSAAAHRPRPEESSGSAGGLLVADECHGLGGRLLRRALLPEYEERLGLTATLERADEAVADVLLPYFGGICHRYGFEQAVADGVCARPRVAFVGVALSPDERAEYIATEQRLVDARRHLRRVAGMPLEPFGAFLAAVGHLAEHDAGADGRAAREYLEMFSTRRQIVAHSRGKYELLGRLAPSIKRADGTLVFTETVRAANHAINRLDPLVSIDLITGSTARRQRQEILGQLAGRSLDAVAAPRVLDEGLDVPDANLGVVVSASRTRRQMVQRMGRILRRKRPLVAARFVIVFAKDTLEDPTHRFERDGFLDEIERVAAATAVFDADRCEELEAFLAQPGPAVVAEPERLARAERALAAALERHGPAGWEPQGAQHAADGVGAGPGHQGPVRDRVVDGGVDRVVDPVVDGRVVGVVRVVDRVVDALADDLGVEGAYALLCFGRRAGSRALRDAAGRRLADRLPRPGPTELPYLEPDLAALPTVTRPRPAAPRLSTGQAPLQIVPIGSGWQLSCTGCGEASPLVQFRWQVFDQTVDCRCA
jgi:superfamily II DNA or RNA helicase